MTQITAYNALRYAASSRFSVKRVIRYNHITGLVLHVLRYQATRHARADRVLRYEADGPEIAPSNIPQTIPDPENPGGTIPNPAYPGFGMSEADLAWKCGIGDLEIYKLKADGQDLPLHGQIDIELNDSGAHQWSWTIEDPTGEYHPEKVGGEWEGVMTDSAEKVFELGMRWGGKDFRFKGVATGYGHNRTAADRKLTFTWSGICMSFNLFEDSVTLPTIRSTRARVVNMSEALVEALEAASVAWANLPTLGPLRLHHRQDDKPGNWMQRYLDRGLNGRGWGWRFNGDGKIEFYPIQLGAARYRYDETAMVEAENFQSDNSELVGGVKVRRVVENADQAGNPVTCREFKGGYRLEFEQELYGLTWRPLGVPTLGVFSDFICRNAAGNVVSVGDIRGGVWPVNLINAPRMGIKSVEWTFGAQVGVLASEGFGQLIFTGRTRDKQDSEFPAEFETSFSVPVWNDDLIAKVGTKSKELPIDELVGSQADAENYGRAWLSRKLLYFGPKELTVPLNVGLIPGETIYERDPILNRARVGFLRQVRHRIVADPGERRSTYVASGWKVT